MALRTAVCQPTGAESSWELQSLNSSEAERCPRYQTTSRDLTYVSALPLNCHFYWRLVAISSGLDLSLRSIASSKTDLFRSTLTHRTSCQRSQQHFFYKKIILSSPTIDVVIQLYVYKNVQTSNSLRCGRKFLCTTKGTIIIVDDIIICILLAKKS